MPARNDFSTSDLACIVIDNFSPLTWAEDTPQDVSVDVTLAAGTSGATIVTVNADWGDGSNDDAAAGTPPAYEWAAAGVGAKTYADPGTYPVKVTATLSNGQTQTERFEVVII